MRAEGAQRALFHHVFVTDSAYKTLPGVPNVTVKALPPAGTFVTATIDTGGASFVAEWARIWASSDGALVFVDAQLDCKGALCSKTLLVKTPPNAVWFADVQYRTKGLLPQRFSISSEPHIPAGFVPKIRKIDSCLP